MLMRSSKKEAARFLIIFRENEVSALLIDLEPLNVVYLLHT